jgi:putative endonuclease
MPHRASKIYWVYILASERDGTINVGVTNDLSRRVWEHKENIGSHFTRRYNVKRLVWSEEYQDINEAIAREKQLKKWRRQWKCKLIESVNPMWDDLYPHLHLVR